MIVCLEGRKGSGMSLSGVAFAYKESLRTGRKPVVKFALGKKYTYLDPETIRKEMDRPGSKGGV